MPRGYGIRRARGLRRGQTPTEAALWERLRDRRLAGLKFRRQHPFAGYVLDFYCAEKQLLVELDGSVHQEGDQPEYDAFRTAELQRMGLTVLRFPNDAVVREIEVVCEQVLAACGLTPRPPLHPQRS